MRVNFSYLAATLAALTALGQSAEAQDMVGIRWFGGEIYLLDSQTGMGTTAGTAAEDMMDSMARDGMGQFWTMDESDLVLVDPLTGTTTNANTIAQLLHVTALAWDDSANTMYAVEDGGTFTTNDSLYSIDFVSLVPTLVGNLGVPGIDGMAMDGAGQLWGWETGAISSGLGFGLVRINKSTAAVTDVNPAVNGKWIEVHTLTFGKGKLWGVRHLVHEINQSTGVLSAVGAGGGFGDVRGAEFLAGNVALTTYCTAKTNSLACIPSVAGSGSPSATIGSGFNVTCSQVRNNKPGLVFYTVNGAQNGLIFQCGTLCLGPGGIRRTPALNSGGTPNPANDCSGIYAIDMNAFAVGAAGGTPSPGLGVPGNTVHLQFWGRDQGFPAPCNTTLSDAGEYSIGP